MLYFLGWIFFRAIFKCIWRLKVIGLENVLNSTPAIIASNHISLADPQLIGSSIPIPIYYMAKKELFDIPIFGWILKRVNAFPVNRSQVDMHAMRFAKKLLTDGKTLLIFPQGGRRATDDFNSKNGIGMLSCWTQLPIIPCCVVNSNRLKSFKKLIVNFSKPIFPIASKKFTRQHYDELTKRVMDEIKSIFIKYETRSCN